MSTQTSSEPQAESFGDKARTLGDLVRIVEAMKIGETRLVRLLDAPKGMVLDCGQLIFGLNRSNNYRISIIQPYISTMPDYIELKKSYR